MLRIRVELVRHGVGRPKTIGTAVVGQLGRGDGGLHRYAAAVRDDAVLTTPAVVSVEHDRDAGVWALVGTVLEAVAAGGQAEELSPATLDRLERALHDIGRAAPAVARVRAEVYGRSLSVAAAAAHLGTSAGQVDDLIAAGELVALDGPDGPRLPSWQFRDQTVGGRLNGIAQVARVFPGGVLTLTAWATVPNPALGDRSPAAALAAGDVDRVVAIAAAGL